MADKDGVIKPGTEADILVVDRDPSEDATVFTCSGENIDVIIKSEKCYKNRLK